MGCTLSLSAEDWAVVSDIMQVTYMHERRRLRDHLSQEISRLRN